VKFDCGFSDVSRLSSICVDSMLENQCRREKARREYNEGLELVIERSNDFKDRRVNAIGTLQ
jgi:hypothetical protein